jgi:hypothetical protein
VPANPMLSPIGNGEAVGSESAIALPAPQSI